MSRLLRTPLLRLALIEGLVLAIGGGLLALLVVAACLAEPTVLRLSLLPPTFL
jgi:hypothetical protein